MQIHFERLRDECGAGRSGYVFVYSYYTCATYLYIILSYTHAGIHYARLYNILQYTTVSGESPCALLPIRGAIIIIIIIITAIVILL